MGWEMGGGFRAEGIKDKKGSIIQKVRKEASQNMTLTRMIKTELKFL